MKPIKNKLMLFPLDAIEFRCIPNTLRYSKLLHNYMHVTNSPRGRVWAGRFGRAGLGRFGQSMRGLCPGLPTTRRDIFYRVNICPPNQGLVRDFAAPGIQEVIRALEIGGHIIIYCCTKDLAEEVAQLLQAPVYHSVSGSTEEKAAVLQRWRDGEPPYIVATSAFGMGIDNPRVRWVIHIGVPVDANRVYARGRTGWTGWTGRAIDRAGAGWMEASRRDKVRVEA